MAAPDDPTPAYRGVLLALDRAATPAPWLVDCQLYGTLGADSFVPIGVAPHRPADPRLVAEYRNALPELLRVAGAIEATLRRAGGAAAAATILRLIEIFDGPGTPRRRRIRELDAQATQPPWDPSHLVGGMGWIGEPDAAAEGGCPVASGPGRRSPRDSSDAELIAAGRVAVPRLVALLDDLEHLAAATPGAAVPAATVTQMLAAIAELDARTMPFTVPAWITGGGATAGA